MLLQGEVGTAMRIIIGISGASGAILGYELLKTLRSHAPMELHLVITANAEKTIALETGLSLSDYWALADFTHDNHDMAAIISSGSFVTDGMVVIPCSMKTLAAITHGYTTNLLTRAADVCQKENRRVVLVPREMPLNKVHLRNMEQAADDGYVIIPPMMTFYNQADSVQKQIDHIIGKIMLQFGLESNSFIPWQEPLSSA